MLQTALHEQLSDVANLMYACL